MQLSVLDQFKLYRQYQFIVANAERFFNSSTVFNNFKDQAFKAYTEGNLDDFQFAIDALTTLEASQNSPLYNQQVDLITESPQFDNFVTILSIISEPQQEAEITSTSAAFTNAVNYSLQIDEEQTIIQGTPYTSLDAKTVFPQTNKIVLDTNTTVEQSEKFMSGDGFITNPQAFTSIQLEQERESAFTEALSEAQSETEAQDLIYKFTPDSVYPETSPAESINTSMYEEYFDQVDPTIVSQEISDINQKITEELIKLHGGQSVSMESNPSASTCQDISLG